MIRRIPVVILFILLLASISGAQPSALATKVKSGTSSSVAAGNACSVDSIYQRVDTGHLFLCPAGVWVDYGTGAGGGGTVTTVSVASANGFAGTVANPTTTPAITVQTSITGILKGNGTAISAATAGTDYSTASATETFTNKTYDTAGTGNSFSINGVAATANTGTGAVARATSPAFTTPDLGTPSAAVLTNATGTAASLVAGQATILQNARTIGGTSFNGSANITVASATGGFTVSGGTLAAAAVTSSSTIVQTSNSAAAFESGPNGSTNPVLRLVNSTASQADGISITGLAAGSGTTIAALSSGSNAGFTLTPKGTGVTSISLNALRVPDASGYCFNTATASCIQNSGGIILSDAGTQMMYLTSTGSTVRVPSTAILGFTSGVASASQDATLNRVAAKVIAAGSAAGTSDHWFVDAGTSRVSTQFDVTSSTVLANVTGLTATVIAGRKYSFVAELYTSSNVAGGVQAAIAGTATATSVIYDGFTISAGTTTQTRATTLGTTVGGITAVTAAHIRIEGTIVVNAGGTLTVQFAQNASNGAASSVLINSTFVVKDLNN